MVPAELGQALRRRRREVGLALRELARVAEISAASLSAIENGRNSPTLATLHKILRALGTDFAEFFSDSASQVEALVFRAEEMKRLEDEHRQYRLLLPKRADIRFEVLHETIAPSETESDWETHDCDFAGVLLSGGPTRLETEHSGSWHVRDGDAFYVKAGEKHRLCVTGSDPVELITVWHPPRY